MKINLQTVLSMPVIFAALGNSLSFNCDYERDDIMPEAWHRVVTRTNSAPSVSAKATALETTTITQTQSVTLYEAPPPAATSTVTVRETIKDKASTPTTWQVVTATNYAYKTGSGLILSTSPLRYDDLLTNYTTAHMVKVAEEVEAMIKTLTSKSSWSHTILPSLSNIEAAIKLLQQCAQIRKQIVAHVKAHPDDFHALRPGYIIFGAANRLLRTVENGLNPYPDLRLMADPSHASSQAWNTLQELKKENQEPWTAFKTLGRLDDELLAALTKREKSQSPDNLELLLATFVLAGMSALRFALITGLLDTLFFALFIVISKYTSGAIDNFMARRWGMKVVEKLEKREQDVAAESQEAVSTDAKAKAKVIKKGVDADEGNDWIVVDKTGSEADDVEFSN